MKINKRELRKFLTTNMTTSCSAPITKKSFKQDIKKCMDFLITKETIIPILIIPINHKIITGVVD